MTIDKSVNEVVMAMAQQKAVDSLNMMDCPSAKQLAKLAEHPPCLKDKGFLTPKRITSYKGQACGFTLLYGTEKVNEEIMKALIALATEMKVLEKMHKMQNGEVMNYINGFPSEDRPVLHTAVRDFFENQNESPRAVEARKTAWAEVEKLKKFIQALDKEGKFKHVFFIAIGGSELGPKAHYLALEHLLQPGKTVHFIGNIDPDSAASALQAVDLDKTLVLVVSKSGTTLETTSNEEFLRSQFAKKGLDPNKHFVAITSAGSAMDDRKKYREVFNLWDWVGGRFSTSSMVGGVVLAFAFGFDVYMDFLRGASAMDKTALNPDIKSNIPLLSSLLTIWNHNFLGYHTQALIPYSQALHRYSAHIQQVEMESNGKRIDQNGNAIGYHTCPIIWGEPGTNAQHSFFQLIHQGTEEVHLNFIGFAESTYGLDHTLEGTTQQQKLIANLLAQALSLALGKDNENPNKQFPGNVPSNILLARKLTPYHLGALYAFYEHKSALQGFLLGINSFDQEGVQLGKVMANDILALMRQNGSGKIEANNALEEALLAEIDNV